MTKKTTYRTLTIMATAAASALLIAGCNSSSSGGGGGGDGGGSSNGFDSLSQQEKEVLVASMAADMDDFVTGMEGMGDMVLGMTGAESSYENPREARFLGIQSRDDQVSTQSWGDLCDTGSHNVLADNSDHFHAHFDNCGRRVEGDGFSHEYTINGTVEAKTSGSDTHDYRMMSRADNYAVETSLSSNQANISVAFKMNGESNQDYTAWNDFVLAADQNVEFDMRCDGSRMQARIDYSGFDVTTRPSSEVPGDAQMDLSGEFSMTGNQPGMGGSWTMNTVSPIHFPQSGNPYRGEVNVVVNGEPFNVEYEQDGAWINGTYYTWAELEAQDDDFDDDWEMEGCLI